MNTKEMTTSLVMAVVVMTMFASSAMAAITVDGQVSPANEWDGDWLKDDPCTIETHGMGLWGYNLEALYQHYDVSTDTLYFRLDVCGIPADLDGDGSTGIDLSPIPPGDWAGVGPMEQYTIMLTSAGKPGVDLFYKANTVSHTDGFAAWGPDCVEFSLDDASDYVDPLDYCIYVSAGGSHDTPYSEDLMDECYQDDDPHAEFSYTGTGCMEVTLDASASWDSEGPIAKFEWDLDNNGAYEINNGANPIFVADVATTGLHVGTNTIRLRVTDSAGQTHSTNVPPVIVTGHPTVTAMANGVTGSITLPPGGGLVTITGTATPYAGTTIVSTTWSIGPHATPGTATGLGPFTVNVTDTSTAALTVVASNGCSYTASVLIRVEAPQQEVPLLTIPGAFALIGMLCIVGAGRVMRRK